MLSIMILSMTLKDVMLSIKTLNIIAVDTVMLIVASKSIMLSVIMLNVMMLSALSLLISATW